MLPAEENEDEPGTDLREAECAADSLGERRAALAAASPPLARAVRLQELLWMQSAGKRGLHGRAEGHGDWMSSQCPKASARVRIASPRAKVGVTYFRDGLSCVDVKTQRERARDVQRHGRTERSG